MDVSAVGQASAQVSAGQRAQQVSIAALRSSQLQAQSIASMLTQSTAATSGGAPSTAVQPPSQPAQSGNGGDTGGGAQSSSNAGQARGSLLNILV